ncbi:MAG: 4Fe-4S cluster-binding domain-containing protein [Candidatus Schekmanbacteria bacterium]|nr:MAG: 4Fe-4S cluster-binding domain-containing protein [Candidatus Schekmanbacteria bacterium]
MKDVAKKIISYFSPSYSYVILFVTQRCNARCKTCFSWKTDPQKLKNELSIDEYEKITSKMRDFVWLSIGGGEPFLREDIAEIVNLFHKNCSVSAFTITTNCLQPEKTAEKVEQILKRNNNADIKIVLSVDGTEEVHDSIRGIEGNFKKFVETYSLLYPLKRNFPNLFLFTNTTFCRDNQHNIDELLDYLNSNFHFDGNTMGLVRGDARIPSQKDIDIELYFNAIEKIRSLERETKEIGKFNNIVFDMMTDVNKRTLLERKMILPCVAGKKAITIDSDGTVLPCEMMPQLFPNEDWKLGDLRSFDYDIDALLSSEKSKMLIKRIQDMKCHCTFECYNLCNVVFNYNSGFKILWRYLTGA